MVDLKIERTPFQEAIDFFQQKVKLPSNAYTDLLHAMHDKAFVIAGVTDTAILTDVHDELVRCMQDGIPFDEFEKRFEKIIESRWLPTSVTGEPNTGWRARLVYDTNMQTAYAAGQYEQRIRVKDLLPYWRYIHTGESKVPRQEHLRWHGLVLRWDDPWWDTHTPPNGWGCTCTIEACDEIDLHKMGKNGPDTPPKDEFKTVRFGNREILTPKGVDPAWAYAPGAGGNQGLLRALAQGHPPLAAEAWSKIGQTAVNEESGAFRHWASQVLSTRRMSSEVRVVGFMKPYVLAELKKRIINPASAAIEIRGKEVLHLRTARKVKDGTVVTITDILNLPEILENPKAVLIDKRDSSLLYVFDPQDNKNHGKFVVKVGTNSKIMVHGKRVTRALNRVESSGLVETRMLNDTSFYERIDKPGLPL